MARSSRAGTKRKVKAGPTILASPRRAARDRASTIAQPLLQKDGGERRSRHVFQRLDDARVVAHDLPLQMLVMNPPSTRMTEPVTYDARSDARKATTSPYFSGRP